MRAAGLIKRWMVWSIIVLLVLPPAVLAQEPGEAEQSDRFRKEELAQMLAPIALYPDSLVADILMASTYPLEIVEAERWLRANKDLKGDALTDALQEKPWDASIKVLCHFPELIFSMSDKLDQTRKLGDAFLSQQEDVMAVAQELRRKAMEQGTLKTTREQTVVEEDDKIRIEPADPQIVYVPVYDPLYVYGPWWYPAYPPYYWYYPPGVGISGGYIGFGPSFYVGISFSWFWFDWHSHYIHIDHDRLRRFDRFRRERRDFGQPRWIHDPYHRHGVAYRDRISSERFGGRTSQTQPPTIENRGYPGTIPSGPTVTPSPIPGTQRRFERPSVTPSPIPERRDQPGTGPSGPAITPSPIPGTQRRFERPSVTPSPIPERRGQPERRFEGPAVAPQPGVKRLEVTPTPRTMPEIRRERIAPFSGVGNGSFERKASERGGKSQKIEQQDRRRGGGGGKGGRFQGTPGGQDRRR